MRAFHWWRCPGQVGMTQVVMAQVVMAQVWPVHRHLRRQVCRHVCAHSLKITPNMSPKVFMHGPHLGHNYLGHNYLGHTYLARATPPVESSIITQNDFWERFFGASSAAVYRGGGTR